MLSGRSKSKDLDAVAGDGDPVTLLSMAKRRAPTPGAQWSARVEMQSDEKIAVYNRQKPPVEHLKVIDDQIYSGLLRFSYCPTGSSTTKSHDLHVTSEMTCADVVPRLRRYFFPHLNGISEPVGSISLVQGEMERVLDDSDKPLQIALECSTKGLASPKFLFRPPVDPLTSDGSPSHRMRTSGFTSYVGALAAHSNLDLAIAPSSLPVSTQSPHLPTQLDRTQWLSTDGEQNSLYSVDSFNSLAPTGAPIGAPHSTLHRMKHMSKSVTALEQKPKSSQQKKRLTHMLSDNSEPNSSPPSTMQYLQPPPTTPTRQPRMTRAKNSVGNFFTRSLRNQKKLKPKGKLSKPSLYGDATESESHSSLCLQAITPEDSVATVKLSQLASPLVTEVRTPMDTIMHIHYRNNKDALIYKSLHVSQNGKAREVVLEALKTFGLTVVDPRDFNLFEVVGRWEDVSQSVENEGSGLAVSHTSILALPRPAVTSIEEFIVYYSREIGPNECPFNLQFYYAMQEGFTRRFELREKEHGMPPRYMSRSYQVLDMKDATRSDLSEENATKRLSWANAELFCKGDSPLFGVTSQRSRRAKRQAQVSSSLNSAVVEGSDTEEDILDRGKSKKTGESSNEGSPNKVKLRTKKVHLDSLLTDEVESFTVDSSTARPRQPLLSATSSSPDSGVVSFKKLRHNSEDLSLTADNHHHLESASVYTDTPTHTATTRNIMQLLKTPFLLNLKLHDPDKEPLIEPLEAETVHFTSGYCDSCKDESPDEGGSTQHVCLYHDDLPRDPQPLCSLRLQTVQTSNSYSVDEEHAHSETGRAYVLHAVHPDCSVQLNGNLVVEPTPLTHGDLISVLDERYMFLFQEHTATTIHTSKPYNWRPHPVDYPLPSSPLTLCTPLPSSPIIKEMRSVKSSGRGDSKARTRDEVLPVEHARLTPLHLTVSHAQHKQPSRETVRSPSSGSRGAGGQTPSHVQEDFSSDKRGKNSRQVRPYSSNSLDYRRRTSKTPTKDTGSLKRQKKSRSHRRLSSSSSSVISAPHTPARKSLFSFSVSEETDLLRCLVTEVEVSGVSCYLGPALLLAMCTEYSHKCHGPVATARFIQKTVDAVQEVVWECTKKLTQWKPDSTMASRPLSQCESLFPLLQPTVFWLANALELHHLLTHSCSPLPDSSQHTVLQQTAEEPLTILHDILVYTFQQMFYTVSKVLFYSLPLVLDSCKQQRAVGEGESVAMVARSEEEKEGGAEDEIVEQAVEFLQALLDLMTDLHLHLEVVSCFYANLFFFINTTLLNSVMKLGPQRGLFTHPAGTTLRSSLTLLEGWACQVGFKDAVLHHLAKLSSMLDILAMPPRQLLQLSWDELREEFPVLHPSQLHLMLSHYIPPPSLLTPSNWAPTHADMSPAHDTALVNESYNCHPGFTLPHDSYSLSLTKTPPQPKEFQALIEDLHSMLKQSSKSVDVVPVVESAPSAKIPTLLIDLPTPTTASNITTTTTTTTTTTPHDSTRHKPHVREDRVHGGSCAHVPQQQDTPPEQDDDNDEDRIHEQTAVTMVHSRSHDCLLHTHNLESSSGVGIGSNTESQEDLLDDRNCQNKHDRNNTQMGDKSNSGSKVADLISTYEESAKLSQSSSESVKLSRVEQSRGRGDGEILGRNKVNGCDENTIDGWEPSSFPDGARLVNIQRGDKGFGVFLVEQKDPLTGMSSIFVQRILSGSTADQCKGLEVGDKVLAIDGQLLEGADYIIAEKYLKEAEDDVQLVIARRSLKIHS